MFLTIAATLIVGPAQTFAAPPVTAAPAIVSPTLYQSDGCPDEGLYSYENTCVLPPFRWGGAGEKLVYDESGLLGAIKSAPSAIGGFFYTISGLIWTLLMYIVRLGLSTGSSIWVFIGGPIARLTAMFGGTLLPLSITLVFITMIQGAKKTFSKGNIFMNFLRQGVSWIFPFTMLFVLVSSSAGVVRDMDAPGADPESIKATEYVGTGPWFAVTVDKATLQAAAALSALNVNLIDSSDEVEKGPGCTDYIEAISEKYLATNKKLGADGDKAAPAMVAISNLWVNTHYANVIRGQFGTPNGQFDLPGFVGCHAYESWNDVPVVEQYTIVKASNPDINIDPNARILGPYSGKKANTQFVKAMTAWAACDTTGKLRDPYRFLKENKCDDYFLQSGEITEDTGRKFYVFAGDIDDNLQEKGFDTGDRAANIKTIRPAHVMGSTMSGHGTARLLYGLMSLISAIVSLIVIGPMAVGLLVTVFMSIVFVTLALPVALLLLAGGKAEKAKPLFKATAASLVAKAMFTVILSLVIAVIKLFNTLIIFLEDIIPGGSLPALIQALLYGIVPLLAFAIVNKLMKMLIPSANFMNPMSTVSLAAQAAGMKDIRAKKPKYDKDGKEIPKKESRWGKHMPKSKRLAKAKDALDRKRGRVDAYAPTWKNFKKFQPSKRFRSAEADVSYLKHREAKDEAKKTRIDAKAKTKASREELREQVDARKASKKSKKDAKEGLRAKQGEPLDPEALDKSKTLASSKPGISKNSAGDNRKDNKGTDDLATRKVQNDTGNPAEDREKALLDVARDREGPILSKLERNAQLLATMGTDDLKEAAMYGLVTTDGHVIDTRNALHDKSALKDLTDDELWERVSNSAPGLGADLAPKINPKTGELETEIEQAARIKTIMRARGLSDNDGNEVHAMEVLGVNKTQLAAYVESGSTGNKDLDKKLKNYENGNCAEFACADNVYETKAIQIAQAVQEERVRLVEVLGLDGANSHVTDRKADVVTKGKEFITLTAESTLHASNLAATEPDMDKVVAGIKDIVEKQFSTLRGSVPDDAVYARLVERAMESTVINVINQATVNTAVNGMGGAANTSELIKLVDLVKEQVVTSQARQGNQQIHIQYTPMDTLTIDNMITQIGVTMEDSIRETAKWASLPSGEDRSKSARIVAIREQETANQFNTLSSAFEAALVAQNQERSQWARETGYSPESITAQQIAAADAISQQTLELKQVFNDLKQAYKDEDFAQAQRHQTRVSELLQIAVDKTEPSDAFSSSPLADSVVFALGTDAFKRKAAAAATRRTSGMP